MLSCSKIIVYKMCYCLSLLTQFVHLRFAMNILKWKTIVVVFCSLYLNKINVLCYNALLLLIKQELMLTFNILVLCKAQLNKW